eukprot:scaffold68538_cov29-Tisochrysis_lutea.AAC.6
MTRASASCGVDLDRHHTAHRYRPGACAAYLLSSRPPPAHRLVSWPALLFALESGAWMLRGCARCRAVASDRIRAMHPGGTPHTLFGSAQSRHDICGKSPRVPLRTTRVGAPFV